MTVVKNRKAGLKPSSEAFALETYFFYWIGHIDALYRNKMRLALKRIGLSVPAWRTLAMLHGHGPMSTTELAQFTVIERTALTHVVDQMETAGLVQRRTSKVDRRRADLMITSSGQVKYEQALLTMRSVYEIATAGIEGKRLADGRELMKEIVRNLGGVGYKLISD